ncbi:hypothetical protein K503DRAFT_869005 [Rhizopogon vinicolor AM-OR11-026]|uniref:Protein kinase domain-containing protein n=1 Tax=Rhizopogon vinicolor AM-OR11-026 TaxID=1314800 RepID=A0A1B7MNY8_9AGAM|nr:hypothetical protein K503DRAFT_869005 [Rhizopogon vinicolor AM-OR11-026]
MSSQYTPVKPHAGSIQNFNVVRASSGDLVGHIEYRSAKPINSYQHWSIASIDTIVNTIETKIRQEDDLARFLQNVRDELHEAELYEPLNNIFRMIEGAVARETRYKRSQFRQLVEMSDHVPDAEDMSFPVSKPDFALAEVPQTLEPLTPVVDVRTIKWRQICGFIEVKPKFEEGPNLKSKAVRTIVSQGANYARLILAARPFQLYVLCVFIYGPKFSLGWYDRRGVIISDDYDINGHLDILIRVVLQLTTHMTSSQLGHDKTACLLEGHSQHGRIRKPQWNTDGAPIWSSLSLLGRGTATWRAVSLKDGQKVVLKTLWRSRTRQSETEIYHHIKPGSRGVSKLCVGDDVRFIVSKETNVPVTVGWLRSSTLNDDSGARDDPVLHCLAMSTVGRPLWEAQTSEEFILGSHAALKGHEILVNHGILHRDMSPGNLYVGEPGCPEGSEGFVADLEFASVTQPITTAEPIERLPEKGQLNKRYDLQEYTVESSSKPPDAEITGTALFMASELLEKMLSSRANEKSKIEIHSAEIKRDVHHDLESFILVLFYAAIRRGLESKVWRQHPEFHRISHLHRQLFGGHTIEEIASGRSALVHPIPQYLFLALDPPMRQLLYGCRILLQRQYSTAFNDPFETEVDEELQASSERKPEQIMTYENLYSVYRVATRNLSTMK